MKNLHTIQPNIPDWVLELTKSWYANYKEEYPLILNLTTQKLGFRTKRGNFEPYSKAQANAWMAGMKQYAHEEEHPEIVEII